MTVPAVLRGCMVRVAGFAVPVMAAVPYTSTGAFGMIAAAISDIFHTRARGIMGNSAGSEIVFREDLQLEKKLSSDLNLMIVITLHIPGNYVNA